MSTVAELEGVVVSLVRSDRDGHLVVFIDTADDEPLRELRVNLNDTQLWPDEEG